MPPQQQNQYDFILESKNRRGLSLNFGKTPNQRIAIVVIGLILLIVCAFFFNSFLNRGNKAHAAEMAEIVKSQNEIIRVSTIVAKDGKTQQARNRAFSTKFSIQTSQNDVKALLAKRGFKGKKLTKVLKNSKNTKNDDTLKEGGLNNRYDETYYTLLNKQLADNQKLIKAAFPSSNANEKKSLTAAFNNAGKLSVKQAFNR